jgi:mRNA interferase MazF
MAAFVKGEIVILPFPFSDLTGSKRRPALVLADLPGDDLILCQITSQHTRDPYSISLTPADLISGSLVHLSHIRPNRIFTADEKIVIRSVATLSDAAMKQVIDTIVDLLTK